MGTSERLITFGETMGLFAADQPGRFGVDRSFTFGIGGAESNVAIGAARLGAVVTWFGRVGSDAIGDLIERVLVAENIDALAIRDSAYTGIMVKHDRFADLSRVDYHRQGSAGSRLTPQDIPEEAVCSSGVLHLTGITPALSPSARQTVFQAVEVARAARVPVSLDVNYRRKLWTPDDARRVLRDLASRCDMIFAGRGEADLVTGATSSSAEDAARALRRSGAREVIIKDGARGCYAIVEDTCHEVPALAVRVVDPVGAGDAFVAGYLSDLLSGADAKTRLVTAVRAGGLAVSVPGDCENLPYRGDLAMIGGHDVTR